MLVLITIPIMPQIIKIIRLTIGQANTKFGIQKHFMKKLVNWLKLKLNVKILNSFLILKFQILLFLIGKDKAYIPTPSAMLEPQTLGLKRMSFVD